MKSISKIKTHKKYKKRTDNNKVGKMITSSTIKYKAEDNINFEEELKKYLDNDVPTINTNINRTEENNNQNSFCLITGEPLESSCHIMLGCKHTFNTIPFIKQVFVSKHSKKICPYCRKHIENKKINTIYEKIRNDFVLNEEGEKREPKIHKFLETLRDKIPKTHYCNATIKSGPNKGKRCICRVVENQEFCKKHIPKNEIK